MGMEIVDLPKVRLSGRSFSGVVQGTREVGWKQRYTQRARKTATASSRRREIRTTRAVVTTVRNNPQLFSSVLVPISGGTLGDPLFRNARVKRLGSTTF